jgi:hypothetical protein
MTRREEEEQDFNVFVGTETGILKGVNVNRKMCISKNFHNLKSLQKVPVKLKRQILIAAVYWCIFMCWLTL